MTDQLLENNESLATFDDNEIRRVYDEDAEVWYFSVIDIVRVLTDQPDYQKARKYWNKLKQRLTAEGSQTVTNCHRLKLVASDGKQRLTDVATAEVLLRLVQSIPSPKAEPVKLWLARVGYERMKETVDPEISIDRAVANWRNHGRSEQWIQQRMMGQKIRQDLTDYWSDHAVESSKEYAILTNIIHAEWTGGLGVKAHKKLKGLKDQNLRDHMTNAELVFTALAELSTRQIAEKNNATGFVENSHAAREGGSVARVAREELEQRTGNKVVSGENMLPPDMKRSIPASEDGEKG